MNTLLDGGYPDGALNYWRSSLTRGLPDGLIDTLVERFAAPSPMSAILLEHFHAHRAHRDRGPTPRTRLEPFHPLGLDRPRDHRREHPLDPRDARRRAAAPLKPALAQLPRRRQGRRDHPRRLRQNYRRLQEIKRRYDRTKVLHLNHNIAP